MQSKVSIITVNYNGKKFLKNFFDSIKNLKYQNLEIIFVDNASNDESVEYVKKNFQKVIIVENKENLGFAVANIKAAKGAKGKYLFFLNNDTEIDSNAISELVKRMEENQKIGICGCKIMSYDKERHFHTGIGVDIFGYPIVWSKVFYIEGSALMIRKKLFEELGGFDLQYFMFHEDIDLAWRAQLLGYEVKAFPEAVVYHVGGGVASGEIHKGRYRSSYLRRYYSERNNIRTLLKNYQTLTLLFIIHFYFFVNLIEILIYLVMFKFKVVYLYLKAYIWNLVNLGNTFKERTKIQKSRVISDKQLMKKMYFGSGKLFAFRIVGIPVFQRK